MGNTLVSHPCAAVPMAAAGCCGSLVAQWAPFKMNERASTGSLHKVLRLKGVTQGCPTPAQLLATKKCLPYC
jgi:hypothetical protein